MTNSHLEIFFGQNAALLVRSVSKMDPFLFLYCFKKRSDIWERPYKDQGDMFKCSLGDIIMIQKVLNQNLAEWNASRSRDERTIKISFGWEEDIKKELWINIGTYAKVLNLGQVGVLNLLLSHIMKEKIHYATSLKKKSFRKKNKSAKFTRISRKCLENELYTHDCEPFDNFKQFGENNTDSLNKPSEKEGNLLIKDEVLNNLSSIEGLIKSETKKAVLINFTSGKEIWIPKSSVRCHYSPNRDINQKFLIENWILKRNKILPY